MSKHERNPYSHPLALLRYTDLVELGIVTNRMTLRRWVQTGDFPRPLILGPNSRAWRASEVQEWLEARERTSRASDR